MRYGTMVGNALVFVEATPKRDRDNKPVWAYDITAPGLTCSGDDLRGWGDACEMLGALLSFMSAAAEGSECFPPEVAAWCSEHRDDIDHAALVIGEG